MSNFSDGIVNQQFVKVYARLKEDGKIKSKSDIANHLGTYNHVINSILKGKRKLTIEQMNKLIETYDVNANFLFDQSKQMFASKADGDFPTLSITEKIVAGRNNITLVPQKAMAGYAIGVENPEYNMTDFKRFSVPGVEGKLLAFEISGDSMLPNITDGDVVICEPIEREGGFMPRLKDNAIYVIVRDDVVAKRVQQIKESGSLKRLRLISDNADFYKPYDVELEEVKQILRVKYRLTSHGIA